MASTTTNFHFYNDDNLPVKVDVRADGDYWVTVGDWPSSVTMFMTAAQAETLRKAIQSAQDDQHYATLETAEHTKPPMERVGSANVHGRLPKWHGLY